MSRAKLRVLFSVKVCQANFLTSHAAYPEMYLEPIREIESFEKNGGKIGKKIPQPEEPTRLFSGLMLAEDTNERFPLSYAPPAHTSA